MSKYVLGEAGARKLRALMAGRGVSGSVPGGGPGLSFDSDYVFPFTVQWAASVNSGEGGWIIWLPSSSALVVVDNTAYNPAEDLEAAGGDYPSGWFYLDDAIDSDTGGDLYLIISDDLASFASSPSTTAGDKSIKICTAVVDTSTEARTVRQYVYSAIIMSSGSGESRSYFADEYSISQKLSDGTVTNFFQLDGFGRFTDGSGRTIGTFEPSQNLDISEDEATTVSFLARIGNSDTVNLNQLAYKTFTIKCPSSPFKYTKTTSTDPTTHETVTTHKLVNCTFYWRGAIQTLSDFDVSGIVSGGTVYLSGTQNEPSTSTPDPAWTWSMGTSAASAPSGGKVLNYKLYDFASGKPSVDYRDTFLSLEDDSEKAQVLVKKKNATQQIELNSAGDLPKLVITNGSDKSITLDLADIPSDCNGALSIHELTYVDESGDEQIYHGIFCDDIDLPQIEQKTLEAGSGIRLGRSGNTITIINTAGSGGSGGASTSGYTGSKDVITDVQYDVTTHKLLKKVETWTFRDGLLKSVTVPADMTEITTAVEETV